MYLPKEVTCRLHVGTPTYVTPLAPPPDENDEKIGAQSSLTTMKHSTKFVKEAHLLSLLACASVLQQPTALQHNTALPHFCRLAFLSSEHSNRNHSTSNTIEMAPPVSPNHSMSTPFSPQIRNKDIGKAHTVNVSPRMPAASFSTAATTVWQVDKTKASSKPKPKRPYTPYNLFYLLERELVVQNINGPPKHTAAKRKPAGIAPREEDQIKPSSRYDGIVMAPYWYDPNMKEKRKHRKTQGMVSSFLPISQNVSIMHIYP
jgi:hypothetical protein